MSSQSKTDSFIQRCFWNDGDPAAPLDSNANVVTPENIAFNYQIAGPHRRVLAFLLDSILLVTANALIAAVGGMLLGYLATFIPFFRSLLSVFAAFYLVFVLLAWWGYGSYFETRFNGQTLGKRMLRLRVVTTSGRPINAMQATLRNLIRFADLMPGVGMLFFLQWMIPVESRYMIAGAGGGLPIPSAMVAFVLMMMTSRHQRLGDLVCGTMVVQEEPRWIADLTIADDPRTPALAEYIPPGFVVSRDMAKALAHYVDRRRYFSPGRRTEIAKHLGEPLLKAFGMRPDTSHDLILCALYYRTFVSADQENNDRGDDAGSYPGAQPPSPQMPYPQSALQGNALATAGWTPHGSPMQSSNVDTRVDGHIAPQNETSTEPNL